MALSNIPLSWFFGILVVILALALVLILVIVRIRKVRVEIVERESDVITPLLKILNNYRDGSKDVDSRLDALGKIARQFFKLKYNFVTEKTFDEISELGKDDSEVKSFCDSMSTLRYSGMKISSDKINSLYDVLEKILSRELAKIKADSSLKMAQYQYHYATKKDELTVKKHQDMVEIRKELDKMKTQPPLSVSQSNSELLSSVKSQVSAKPVGLIASPEEQIKELEKDLGVGSKAVNTPNMDSLGASYHEKDHSSLKVDTPVANNTPQVSIVGVEESIDEKIVGVKESPSPSAIKPSLPARDINARKNLSSAVTYNNPLKKSLAIKNLSKKKVIVKKSKIKGVVPSKIIDSKEQKIAEEIRSLNKRIESLMDNEAESRLTQIRDGYY